MKKTLLYFSLMFSTAALANGEMSFLESLLAEKTTPREAVMQNIALWAQNTGNFLSLGESHQESETANQVNFAFAKLYIDQLRGGFTFCSETLDHFLTAEQGQWIQAKSDENLIFKGNGPSRTDFTNCKWSSSKNALTYSGFFHQYPFARPWPKDFPPTPVITAEGNNIRDELSPRRGMFVTQMEMSFLEGRAAQSLLKSLTTSTSAFRARVEVLIETVREVVAQQVQLVEGDSFNNKYGAFYSRDAFAELLPMPAEAWFVVTNRGYRLEKEPFKFFQEMLRLPNENLTKLIMRISGEKSYFYSFGFGPSAAGVRTRTQFAALDLDGESELLQFTNGDTVVSEPDKAGLSCYKYADNAATPVDCSTMF